MPVRSPADRRYAEQVAREQRAIEPEERQRSAGDSTAVVLGAVAVAYFVAQVIYRVL